jgi:hypothetical protein
VEEWLADTKSVGKLFEEIKVFTDSSAIARHYQAF